MASSLGMITVFGSFNADFGVFMRKLRSLCNKLQRIGIFAAVVSHGRRDYVCFTSLPKKPYVRSSFSSVHECEQYLNSFFR